MPSPPHLPFLLHTLIELPASLNFFLHPSSQFTPPAPQAHAVIRQYALLLFSSSLISLIFGLRPVDGTSRNVAGALGVYHFGPLVRAGLRVWGGDTGGEKKGIVGGPWVHLVVHAVCGVGLMGVFLGGGRS
ncbi:hypothetical protein CJF30_00007980 [Rutstroemia sp. NJR-2017a BBW]|nr:hypothetical protein CJF30_00007980 [Rutstroemia sp. NJR-2017a BBW]